MFTLTKLPVSNDTQSNMNALTGPMFNELYGKVAIRVTLIPDFSIMRN